MYTGYLLLEDSKNVLLKKFPPKYPDFIGHHVTEIFGVGADAQPPEKPNEVSIIGHVAVDGVEAFLVSVNGQINRPKGGKYHLTWSLDKSLGRKPVDSNTVIDHAIMLNQEIPINVKPMVFK